MNEAQSELLKVFRAICIVQFAADVDQGDSALASLDAATLRRIAHNLSSVLLTLQEPAVSTSAHRLEDCLVRPDWTSAGQAWSVLRKSLRELTTGSAS